MPVGDRRAAASSVGLGESMLYCGADAAEKGPLLEAMRTPFHQLAADLAGKGPELLHAWLARVATA